ncbi:MAG: hypothetical protein AAF497_19725 [Planctomycetota bacterium]
MKCGIVRFVWSGVVDRIVAQTESDSIERFAAYCRRSQSTIAIIVAPIADSSGFQQFYDEALRGLLREWWDLDGRSVAAIEKRIRQINATRIELETVRHYTNRLLGIVPIPDYQFRFDLIREGFELRNEWNSCEYAWKTETKYGLLAWETTA